ncbi:MAG: 2-oxo acid dehydrogenase subunit E2 [Candidatus Marinimicrobia bacterium]|nr:2-oxo acid dehydrogenase subunit E2 [Candidatus Neomarinimicrobiota bacterium]
MIVDVVMPKLGESIVEGTILEWKAAVGDTIGQDETLLEISTDKVDSEIPAPAGGILLEILFPPNTTVAVGEVMARIGTEGEQAGEKVEEKAEVKAQGKSDEEAPAKAPSPSPSPAPAPATDPPSTRFYSPLVRSIAKERGLSAAVLDGIPGTGRHGRLTKKDLLAYLEAGATELRERTAVPVAQPEVATIPAGERLVDEVMPLSRQRRLIAEHMRQSLDTAAHVYALTECDMSAAVAFRDQRRVAFEEREGLRLTFTPLIALAVIKAIRDFPMINALIDGEQVIKRRHIGLGLAVALPDDNLIVPVVHRAEELNFLGLVRQLADLAERARAGRLQPDEAAGSTFTITNPGVFGTLIGLPIINQPNVGILAVGAIKKRPVVWERDGVDSIVIRSIMMMTLGHDHRLIDGAYGSRFLERISHYLETTNYDELL